MIPAGAILWSPPFDPSDRDWAIAQFGPGLVGEEIIETATVTLLPEAVALGLTVLRNNIHGPWIADDSNIEMWFEIEEGMRENVAFRSGADLPVEITIVSDPDELWRRLQRTFVLRVIHQ